MAATAEQLRIAATIDAKMQQLLAARCDDAANMGEMFDHMAGFKQLMDGSRHGEMDELCQRFPSFYRYAKLLESVAAAMQSGAGRKS